MDFTRASHPFIIPILATGAELKSSFCLAKDNCVFLSEPFGNLEDLETLRSFEAGIESAMEAFGIKPRLVAYDMHPEYLSTKYALSLTPNTYHLLPIQHHHAHIASCMAEHHLDEKVLGVAFDGLGFGEDGYLWGGEFLIADYAIYERKAHLEYVPLVSGRQAIREPWRMAAVWLYKTFGRDFLNLDIGFVQRLERNKWSTLEKMIETKFNSPLTSSMGRLFDAVSSLVGIRDKTSFEAEAAIELEKAMGSYELELRSEKLEVIGYKFEIREEDSLIIDPRLIFKGIVEDLKKKKSVSEISKKFHWTITEMVKEVCLKIRQEVGLNKVVLSGGVFQNNFLFKDVPLVLKASGFEVFTHSRVPTNDAGISLGQAVIANRKVRLCV
jgi:hydrogenase maturation protein HypF